MYVSNTVQSACPLLFYVPRIRRIGKHSNFQRPAGIKMNIPLRKGNHDALIGQCFIDHVTQVAGDDHPGDFRLELDPDIQTEKQGVAAKVLELHLGLEDRPQPTRADPQRRGAVRLPL